MVLLLRLAWFALLPFREPWPRQLRQADPIASPAWKHYVASSLETGCAPARHQIHGCHLRDPSLVVALVLFGACPSRASRFLARGGNDDERGVARVRAPREE